MNVIFYQVAILVDLAIKHHVTIDQAKIEYSKNVLTRKGEILLFMIPLLCRTTAYTFFFNNVYTVAVEADRSLFSPSIATLS